MRQERSGETMWPLSRMKFKYSVGVVLSSSGESLLGGLSERGVVWNGGEGVGPKWTSD